MGTILGVGPLEVLAVGVLTLLIFGPERLPELTRNLGSAIRKLRQTYVAFVTEFRDEITPIVTEVDAVTRELREDLNAIREAADIRGLIPSITDADIGAADLRQASQAVNTAISEPLTPAAPMETIAAPTIPVPAADMSPPKLDLAAMYPKTYTPPTLSPAPVLSDDNPWASAGAPVRTDQLDDDSPWKV